MNELEANPMIKDELEKVLARWYPKSQLENGYDFVVLGGTKGGVWLSDAGVAASLVYEELFRSESHLLVTCVMLDLAACLPKGAHVEERDVSYTPDWYVSESVQQRFASIQGGDLDAGRFFGSATSSFNAAYVVSPRTGLALTYDKCFAATDETLLELQRRYPDRRHG